MPAGFKYTDELYNPIMNVAHRLTLNHSINK